MGWQNLDGSVTVQNTGDDEIEVTIERRVKNMDKLPFLPEFPAIGTKQVPSGCIGIAMGGTKITEFYGNKRADLWGAKFKGGITKFPYVPAPYHAFFVGMDGLTLNVGAFKTIMPLEDHFNSTRRIDIIIPRGLSDEIRYDMGREIIAQDNHPKIGWNWPTYAITDFIRQEPLLRWIPVSRKEFCSENVTNTFRKYGVEVSARRADLTDPWDLYLYAFAHPESFELRTAWVGLDFRGKYNCQPYEGETL